MDLAPEKAVYTIAYNKEKDETDIFLRADREVLSMKTELITCGGKQSLHVITSGEPHPGHGIFEQWGKGHFPSMEESEQLQIWRDKNFRQTMNAVCNTPHRTAAGARKCTSKIPGPNWSGYKPHLMRASRPHVNAIWRSGYYSIPFELNEQGGQLPVPRTSIPALWLRGSGQDASVQKEAGGRVTAAFPVTHLQPWMTISLPGYLQCQQGTPPRSTQWVRVLTIPFKSMINPLLHLRVAQ